tara:strand:- start:334 stop:540 length:207 start_codon:yes stop_codon:yes gene_type:complete
LGSKTAVFACHRHRRYSPAKHFKVLGRQLAGSWGLIIAGIDVIAKIITHATTDDDIRVQLVGSFQVES